MDGSGGGREGGGWVFAVVCTTDAHAPILPVQNVRHCHPECGHSASQRGVHGGWLRADVPGEFPRPLPAHRCHHRAPMPEPCPQGGHADFHHAQVCWLACIGHAFARPQSVRVGSAYLCSVVPMPIPPSRLVGNVFPVEKDPLLWPEMFRSSRRWKAYALSKFATALLALHLNEQAGVSAVAVHPGAVRTQMADGVASPRKRKFLFFLKRMLIEPEQAAQNVLFCVENTLDNPCAEYRHAGRLHKFPPAVCKRRNLDALVRMSRTLVVPFRSQQLQSHRES